MYHNAIPPPYEEEEEIQLTPVEADDIEDGDVINFATAIGIDPIREKHLLYLARESTPLYP